MGALLQGGQRTLQGIPGGVAGAGVLVPGTQNTHTVLRECGGEVEGRDDGAGVRLRLLPGVDGARGEPLRRG